jgi:hypothetical protein
MASVPLFNLSRAGWQIALAGFALAFAVEVRAQDPSDEDPTASREEQMFGEAPPETPDPAPQANEPAPGAARDDAIFGDEDADQRRLDPAVESPGLMERAEQALVVGGQLFLRLNGQLREEQTLGEMPLTSPSLADVFMDVRPTDRLRGFAQVRFTYDFTVDEGERNLFGQEQQQFQLLLDQLWVKLDLGRVAYVTAGRQRIRWGTGRFWNPTDFVNQDIRNSVDFFDQRLGVNLLKVHFPFEQLGWNLYLIGSFDGIDTLDDSGVGARGEFLFGETELAISTLVKKDAPLRVGIDASAGIWLFDVRAEATLQRGLGRRRFEGELDFSEGRFPVEVDTDDDWFFQGVFGGDLTLKYTDQDTIILGGEYFYNQTGYADAKLYPFLALNGAFVPLYLGQHYVGLYAVAPGPFRFNETNLTLSTLANLSDGSALTRLDVQQTVLTYLTFNVFAAAHWGRQGELKLGFEIPPIPGVPALANGLVIPTEIVDVGLAMRISL